MFGSNQTQSGYDTTRRDMFILAVLAESIARAAKTGKSVGATAIEKLWSPYINQFLVFMFENNRIDEEAAKFVSWLEGNGPIPEFYAHFQAMYGVREVQE